MRYRHQHTRWAWSEADSMSGATDILKYRLTEKPPQRGDDPDIPPSHDWLKAGHAAFLRTQVLMAMHGGTLYSTSRSRGQIPQDSSAGDEGQA